MEKTKYEEVNTREITRLLTELGWEKGVDITEWGCTEVYLKTISRGYLL